MSDRLKAISLWQPYASAMKMGLKRNETRNRLTHYRGDLVICSAQRPMDEAARSVLKSCNIQVHSNEFGCALCIVEVYGCQPTEFYIKGPSPAVRPEWVLSEAEYDLGDYSDGRFAWLTRNLRVLRVPVPVIGKQGFFYLTPEASDEVRRLSK